jgi:F0F1-type ATP synthase assembly protein I
MITSLFDDTEKPPEEPFVLSVAEPQSLSENVRQSGLAYSAGIVLFASVAFMLVIGWGADVLLGSSPWGIVSGIVLGALIGFFQFFRLTSQIFKK